MQDMDGLPSSLGLNDPHTLKIAKEALVAGLVLVGAVYVVQSLLQSRKPNRSWMKLRRKSPDPEKNDDPGKFAAHRMKPTDRKPGSELTNVAFPSP